MKIQLLAFGIAKDILQNKKYSMEIAQGASVRELREKLMQQYPDFQALKSISFAVGMEYRTDDFLLSEEDEVVIIPPVSGG
ncbi:MAG: MoaD/ThiS family protein [Bacteroidota bacterium]